MAIYAVGDIQGCFDEFQQLLQLINFGPSDQLWLAGDLVNRGPKSLETLRFVKSLGNQAKTVLGNHDLHLLAVARAKAKPSRKDTLDAILQAPDREELLDWLRQQALLHHDADSGFTMTHAGIPPSWTLQDAKDRAREVEIVLRSDFATDYFLAMYGNKPNRWKDNLEGMERWRCITNYFTRMRFCDDKGRLNFDSKDVPSRPPKGFLPWYAHPHRAMAEQPIIFGHWAALEGKAKTKNIFALDTGCVWGGTLTAMRLDNQQRFSVPSRGYA